jgi:hypothetical protein
LFSLSLHDGFLLVAIAAAAAAADVDVAPSDVIFFEEYAFFFLSSSLEL